MSKLLKYLFFLILGYLLVVHFTGFIKDVAQGGGTSIGLIKALQGR